MVSGCRASAVAARLALAAVLAAIAGCSSSALGPQGGARNGGSTGSGGSNSGSAGSGGAGSDGAAPRCASTGLRANVIVHPPGGGTLTCATAGLDGGSGSKTFRGHITSTEETALTLELCDMGPGCAGGTLRIEASASGLDLRTVPRVAAEVRVEHRVFFQCQQALEIRTAGGDDAAPPGRLLLAIVDGGQPFAGSPYIVKRERLGCSSAKGCGFVEPDVYAFDFSAASGDAPLRVHMGEALPWELDGAAYVVRNLRSYQTIACDDYWNFAYTIVPAPPK